MWNIFSKLCISVRFILCFIAILLLKLAKSIEHIELLIKKRSKDTKPITLPHDVNRLILDNKIKYYQNMWKDMAKNK